MIEGTWAEMLHMAPAYAVYVCAAADGTVLYVGYTGRGSERLAAHTSRPWWPAVAEIFLTRFETEQDARKHETRMIRGLFPLFNVQGRPAGPPAMIFTDGAYRAELAARDQEIAELRADLEALRSEHRLNPI